MDLLFILLNFGRMAPKFTWPSCVLGIARMAMQYFYNFSFAYELLVTLCVFFLRHAIKH